MPYKRDDPEFKVLHEECMAYHDGPLVNLKVGYFPGKNGELDTVYAELEYYAGTPDHVDELGYVAYRWTRDDLVHMLEAFDKATKENNITCVETITKSSE